MTCCHQPSIYLYHSVYLYTTVSIFLYHSVYLFSSVSIYLRAYLSKSLSTKVPIYRTKVPIYLRAYLSSLVFIYLPILVHICLFYCLSIISLATYLTVSSAMFSFLLSIYHAIYINISILVQALPTILSYAFDLGLYLSTYLAIYYQCILMTAMAGYKVSRLDIDIQRKDKTIQLPVLFCMNALKTLIGQSIFHSDWLKNFQSNQ